ncbi:hypothetical protein F2P56_005171 [Juglans regia]|uniref:Uncharacterized protein n=2 Tax=Juglans regia TaxID=51240 RepID=A0A833Y4W9_JUGRE|nr:uncharacterized protein LOC109010477 [Juglans regia]KAF5478628.1 hypothetical protein F2P56_005171 [Juglans regia]
MKGCSINLYENASDVGTQLLRKVLDGCSVRTLVAGRKLGTILLGCFVAPKQWPDYTTANAIVSDQIQPASVNWCLEQFEKHPELPVPSVVLAGTEAVNQDCKIVSGILSNIILETLEEGRRAQ